MSKGEEERGPRVVHEGPSWLLMLCFIALAILVALGIAWLMITPLVHRH